MIVETPSISFPHSLPQISVVMTVFNDEMFVEDAIKSILNQSFNDYEFIIINDGSTDNTSLVLKKYSLLDRRIKIYNQKNSGTTVAANFGLSVAQGKYIARLDSDDISFPNRLKIENEYLEKHPEIVLVGGGSEIINTTGSVIGIRNIKTRKPKETLIHRCIYQQSDVMFRKNIANNLGGYREKFKNAQDYDLWLRMSDVGRIAKLDEILGQWRLNDSGYTLSRKIEQKAEVRIIKQFAKERIRNGRDSYNEYLPKFNFQHRQKLDSIDYNIWIGSIQLQSMRIKESRVHFLHYLEENEKLYPRVLYMITFLPKSLIRVLFSIRDYILNNIG